MRTINLLAWTTVMAALIQLASPLLQAADWHRERDTLLEKARQEAETAVDTQISLDAVAKARNAILPLAPPKAGKSHILQACLDEINQEATEKFPPALRSTIIDQAMQAFPMRKVGDRVSLRTRLRVNAEVEGIVMAISSERVQIGSRWIPLNDLQDQDRLSFDADRTRLAREELAQSQVARLEARVVTWKKQELRRRIPLKLHENGYILENAGEDLDASDPDHWVPALDACQAAYQAERKQVLAQTLPEIERKIMTAHGYVFEAKAKQWRPAGAWNKIKFMIGR